MYRKHEDVTQLKTHKLKRQQTQKLPAMALCYTSSMAKPVHTCILIE
jgi:hypothetical protein